LRGPVVLVVDVEVELVEEVRVWVNREVKAADRVARSAVLMVAIGFFGDVRGGGCSMVAPVRAVAVDLVRAWPAPAGRLDVEGTPEDVVGREGNGDGSEVDAGRGAGLLREVIGGRDTADELAATLLLAGAWRTEADRPKPNTPDIGLLRAVAVADATSPFLAAVDAARARAADGTEDVADPPNMPLTGSLLGETFCRVGRLESVLLFGPESPVAGLRKDFERAMDDIARRSLL
jgi:hypothetical protein